MVVGQDKEMKRREERMKIRKDESRKVPRFVKNLIYFK
jgi:hypothetical protein